MPAIVICGKSAVKRKTSKRKDKASHMGETCQKIHRYNGKSRCLTPTAEGGGFTATFDSSREKLMDNMVSIYAGRKYNETLSALGFDEDRELVSNKKIYEIFENGIVQGILLSLHLLDTWREGETYAGETNDSVTT